MKKALLLLCAAVTMLLGAGCISSRVENNYLEVEDFAVRLQRAGLPVTQTRRLDPAPFRATAGYGITVGESEIGIYKIDPTSPQGKRRLKQVTDSRRFYINGIPYPVEVRGSFAVMGLDKTPYKHQIIDVFDKFY